MTVCLMEHPSSAYLNICDYNVVFDVMYEHVTKFIFRKLSNEFFGGHKNFLARFSFKDYNSVLVDPTTYRVKLATFNFRAV